MGFQGLKILKTTCPVSPNVSNAIHPLDNLHWQNSKCLLLQHEALAIPWGEWIFRAQDLGK